MVGILPLIMVTLLSAMTAQLSTMLARQSMVMGGVNGARQDLDALAQAKQALLDFVIAQSGGHLPCPNQNGDGLAANSDCPKEGNPQSPPSMLGLLPWSSLGLPPLRDRQGQCLWYAVSGWHKSTASGASHADLTEASAAGFSVVSLAGQSRAEQVVAVIMAPASPLTPQAPHTDSDAPCALPERAASSASAYLPPVTLANGEQVNVTQLGTTPRFEQTFAQATDLRMAWITRTEFNQALAHHRRWSGTP